MKDLIGRIVKYRNNLAKPVLDNSFVPKLEESLNSIFEDKSEEFDINDKANIHMSCKISTNEAKTGCIKRIKFFKNTKDTDKQKVVMEIKIPEGIKNGQSIVILGAGNYIKYKDKYSNLVVTIIFKEFLKWI